MYGGRFIPWRDRAPPEASGLHDLVQDFWHKGSFGNGQRGATFALARKCRTEPLRPRRGTGIATAIPSGIFPISDIRGGRPSRMTEASLSNSGMSHRDRKRDV